MIKIYDRQYDSLQYWHNIVNYITPILVSIKSPILAQYYLHNCANIVNYIAPILQCQHFANIGAVLYRQYWPILAKC